MITLTLTIMIMTMIIIMTTDNHDDDGDDDNDNDILLRVFPNRIYENDREIRMVAHCFAEEMIRARISTVWDKWPQA